MAETKGRFGGKLVEDDSLNVSRFSKSTAVAVPALPEQVASSQDGGIYSGISERMQERGSQLYDITDREQNPLSSIFQVIGTEAGAVGDIIDEGIGAGIGSLSSATPNVPDDVMKTAGEFAKKLADNDIFKYGLEQAKKGSAEWGEFEKAHPEAGANIRALGNIVSFFYPAKLAGKGAEKAITGASKMELQPIVDSVSKISAPAIKSVGEFAGKFKKSPIPNADQIRKEASALYDAADAKGGILTEKFTNEYIKSIGKLTPQTEAGKILAGDSNFTKVVEKIGQLKNKPLTLKAAQEVDEYLGDAIDSFTEMGRLTKEGKKLLDVQSKLRGMIDTAGKDMIAGGKEGFDLIKAARGKWATSAKLSDIERIIEKASMTDNPATSIKSGFRALISNHSRMKGYNAAERAAMKKAAQTGVIGDTLRIVGSRLVPIITLSTGGGLGTTAAATAAGMAARSGATAVQLRKAKKAAEIIAGGKKTKGSK